MTLDIPHRVVWPIVVAFEIVLLIAVVGLGVSLRSQIQSQAQTCRGVNHTNSAVRDILNRSIVASREKLKIDAAKHSQSLMALDNHNIASGLRLLLAFPQIPCY